RPPHHRRLRLPARARAGNRTARALDARAVRPDPADRRRRRVAAGADAGRLLAHRRAARRRHVRRAPGRSLLALVPLPAHPPAAPGRADHRRPGRAGDRPQSEAGAADRGGDRRSGAQGADRLAVGRPVGGARDERADQLHHEVLTALALLVLSIGVADSINPSTVAPALYLALDRDGVRRLAGFTAGVFGVYFAGGVVLTLGPLSAVPDPGATVKHLIELGLGAGTLVFAAGLWLTRAHVARRLAREERRIRRSSFLLGATIMAVELPTAFPYFAAITAIVASGRGRATEVLLLVLFNVAFVAPLVAVLAMRAAAGTRGEVRLERVRLLLDGHAPVLLPALALAIAAALLLVGGIGLASEGGA